MLVEDGIQPIAKPGVAKKESCDSQVACFKKLGGLYNVHAMPNWPNPLTRKSLTIFN